MTFWPHKRVSVTCGAGFLGRAVVSRLEAAGAAAISVPRSAKHDLRTPDGVADALAEARPDVVNHLAAVVGGIGVNRENPGRFFYDNAVVGLELMEKARLMGASEFVQIGTVCSSQSSLPCRSARRTSGMLVPRRPIRRTD